MLLSAGSWRLITRISSEFEGNESKRAMAIVWAMWRNRNQVVWNGKSSTPAQVVFSAASYLAKRKQTKLRPPGRHVARPCKRCHCPKQNVIKMNVNAAFFDNHMHTGIDIVIRDSVGECIAMQVQQRDGLMTVKEGEVWGVFEAISWAERMGLADVIIERDAQYIPEVISSRLDDETTYGDLIEDCRRILARHKGFRVV